MLETGARRLGAAFQKVNFLRDLAADAGGLGRAYFPGVDPAEIDEPAKRAILDDIDADLAAAAATLPLLPRGPRRAVALAHGLFADSPSGSAGRRPSGCAPRACGCPTP